MTFPLLVKGQWYALTSTTDKNWIKDNKPGMDSKYSKSWVVVRDDGHLIDIWE